MKLILPIIFTLLSTLGAHGEDVSALATERALQAGDNQGEIAKALKEVPEAQRSGMAFLIAYMPKHDLESLSGEFLLRNVATAYQARETLPWGKSIPEDRFLNDVLPYASINEKRDDWRQDFYERFLPLVKDCKTPGEAAQILNRDLYKLIDVKYHASKRPKPDQSPYESMEAKYASCTGLSVLLIDACRAMSVPARFAGTPRWANKRGNHSWVEVWDQGKWHFTGACEYNTKGLNKVWFLNDASHAKKEDRRHAIYATSWRHTGENFPMIWARDVSYVPAINVTDHYTKQSEKLLEEGECLLGIQIWDQPGGKRVARKVAVRVEEKTLHEGETTDTSNDTNHLFEIVLHKEQPYQLDHIDAQGTTHTKAFTTNAESSQHLNIYLAEPNAEGS